MNAYSRLKRLLHQKSLTVPELQRRMLSTGHKVNLKSLYRLNDEWDPVERLDMRVAGAICQVCDVPLTEWIVFEDLSAILISMSDEKQDRLEELMGENNEGRLTEEQHIELVALVRETQEITLENARSLALHYRRLKMNHPEASRAI